MLEKIYLIQKYHLHFRVNREQLIENIRRNANVGLQQSYDPKKGRIVKATKSFQKGQFLVAYGGEIVTRKEGLRREAAYNKEDPECEIYGSYLYYFKYKERFFCADATQERPGMFNWMN